MYRILVIDDEPIIADGLYELFAQDETCALEVHKVYSAPDALKLLDRLRIDIVLSDIKMPGMNGLALLPCNLSFGIQRFRIRSKSHAAGCGFLYFKKPRR